MLGCAYRHNNARCNQPYRRRCTLYERRYVRRNDCFCMLHHRSRNLRCKGSHFFALFPKLAPKKKATVENGLDVPVDVEPENATETVSEDFSEQLIEESVEQAACEASQEKSDELKEEDALSGEQADQVSREIAENLRDGSIIE